MKSNIHVDARWDDEAHVWLATSDDAPGLVVEAASCATMIEEVQLVLPDLLDASEFDVIASLRAERSNPEP